MGRRDRALPTGKRPECTKQAAWHHVGPGGFEKLSSSLPRTTKIAGYLPNYTLQFSLIPNQQDTLVLGAALYPGKTRTFPDSLAANGGNVIRLGPKRCERMSAGNLGESLCFLLQVLSPLRSLSFSFLPVLWMREQEVQATTRQQAWIKWKTSGFILGQLHQFRTAFLDFWSVKKKHLSV